MLALAWLLPFAFQGTVMAVDEFHFHGRRGLPRWEWMGHALDTSVLLACLVLPLLLAPTPGHRGLFVALALGSCLLVTKDEFLHQRLCTGWEHWCHALLFLVHPVVLMTTGFLWLCVHAPAACQGFGELLGLQVPAPWAALRLLWAQALGVGGFLVFQVVFWVRR